MTKDELLSRVGHLEDNFLERKSAGVKPGEIRQAIVSFANSVPPGRFAVLYIGVHDKTGKIEGVKSTDALQQRVREALDDCYPPITYRSEVLEINGRHVVAVVVTASDEKPHFSGPSFVRVGSQSVKASKEQFQKLIDSRTGKCAALLALQGPVVSVHGVGYKLGSHRPLSDSHYRQSMECTIQACTAEYVTLYNIAASTTFTEPLANITILRDDERGRPLLVITFPRG
jgi:hypothetical protein